MSDAREGFVLLLSQQWAGEPNPMLLRNAGNRATGLKLGVDGQGQRHVLAPIAEDYEFVTVKRDNTVLGEWRHSNGQRYLDLACTSTSLAGVFASLADDVTQRVEKDGLAPAPALLQTLTEWRQLLKDAASLTEEAARGLFGELYVLAELARCSDNPHFALQRWTGPAGELHDFSGGGTDIEVKSSKSDGMDVTINDLHQLDVFGGRPLALVRLHLITDPQGQNISDAVSGLEKLGLVRAEIEDKLAMAGFVPGRDSDAHRFIVQSVRAWEVTAEFPGLRSADIAPNRRDAIRKITYTLDLTGAPALEGGEELHLMFRSVMGLSA